MSNRSIDEEKNTLLIDRIELSDTISQFMEKVNNNFQKIVQNEGGPAGPKGELGNQGIPTKPKVPIHVWKEGEECIENKISDQEFEITRCYEDLTNVKYQEGHIIMLQNGHVYTLEKDENYNLKPKYVLTLQTYMPGEVIDGKKAFVHIAYADDANGNGFVTESELSNDNYNPEPVATYNLRRNARAGINVLDKQYMGIYTNHTQTPSSDPDRYNWIKIQGTDGKDGDVGVSSKIIMIYTSGKHETGVEFVPDKPIGGSYDFNNNEFICPDGWFQTDSEAEPPIWMASRTFTTSELSTDKEWSKPVRITGENGMPGEDGASIEYIFRLTYELTQEDLDALSYSPDNENGYVPEPWKGSPTGIDENNTREWCSIRLKNTATKKWGKWEEPTIWSQYGLNGQDGDGVQYIYYLTNTATPPKNPTPNGYTTNDSYQDRNTEWKPGVGSYDNIDGEKLTFTEEDNWSDNPKDISVDKQYQWMACRKYRQNKEKKMAWEAFSNPTLWSRFGEKGESGTFIRTMYVTSDGTDDIPDRPTDSTGSGSQWSTEFPTDYIFGKNVVWGTTAELKAGSNEFVDETKGWSTPYIVTGTKGVAGEQGPKGDKGDQGIQGPAGNPGFDGIPGTSFNILYCLGKEEEPFGDKESWSQNPLEITGWFDILPNPNKIKLIDSEDEIQSDILTTPEYLSDNRGRVVYVKDITTDEYTHKHYYINENSELVDLQENDEDFVSYVWAVQGTDIWSRENDKDIKTGIKWTAPFKLQGTNGIRGVAGADGNRGQVVYPMGVYNPETTYITTDAKAPYVFDNGNYYVLNIVGEWKGSEENYTTPSQNYNHAIENNIKPIWQKFEGFEAIFTKIGIIANGMVGSAVFNNEFMFSQQGVDKEGNKTDYAIESGDDAGGNSGFLSGYEFDENKKQWKYVGTDIYIEDINVNPYEEKDGTPIHSFRPNVCINFATGQMWLSNGKAVFGQEETNLATNQSVIDLSFAIEEYVKKINEDIESISTEASQVSSSLNDLNDVLNKSLEDGFLSKDEQVRIFSKLSDLNVQFEELNAEHEELLKNEFLKEENATDDIIDARNDLITSFENLENSHTLYINEINKLLDISFETPSTYSLRSNLTSISSLKVNLIEHFSPQNGGNGWSYKYKTFDTVTESFKEADWNWEEPDKNDEGAIPGFIDYQIKYEKDLNNYLTQVLATEKFIEDKFKIDIDDSISTQNNLLRVEFEDKLANFNDERLEELANQITSINGGLEELQKQVDGEVSSYFDAYAPVTVEQGNDGEKTYEYDKVILDVEPLKSWLENYTKNESDIYILNDDGKDELFNNLGDTFTFNGIFDENNPATELAGKSWRWCDATNAIDANQMVVDGCIRVRNKNGVDRWLHWHRITDTDAVRALQMAAEAQATADKKCTVYISTENEGDRVPNNYNIGDLWILNENAFKYGNFSKTDNQYYTNDNEPISVGDILNANQASVNYSVSHWSKQVKYTDDTAAEVAQQKAQDAQDTADAAKKNADIAKAQLDAIDNDNVISKTEFATLETQLEQIEAEHKKIVSDCILYEIDLTQTIDLTLESPIDNKNTFSISYNVSYNKAVCALKYHCGKPYNENGDKAELEKIDDVGICIKIVNSTSENHGYLNIPVYYEIRQYVLNKIAEKAIIYAESYADTAAKKAIDNYETDGINLISTVPGMWKNKGPLATIDEDTSYDNCFGNMTTQITIKEPIKVSGNIYLKIHNSETIKYYLWSKKEGDFKKGVVTTKRNPMEMILSDVLGSYLIDSSENLEQYEGISNIRNEDEKDEGWTGIANDENDSENILKLSWSYEDDEYPDSGVDTFEFVEELTDVPFDENKELYLAGITQFDSDKKYIGDDYWIDWTDDSAITLHENTQYIGVSIKTQDSADIINDDIKNVKIKIEKGNRCTPYTPSPKDVEQAIVDAEDRMGEGLASAVETINGGIDALQKQVDGEVNSWFMEGEPTLNNAPANEWTTDELKQRHEGDTYTDISEITLLGSWLWEQGGFLSGGGETNSDIYIRSIDYIANNGGTIYVPSNSNITIHYYNENKEHQKFGSFSNSFLPNASYPYFRLLFRLNPTANITPSIADELKLSINPTSGQSWRWCNCTYTDESGTSITGWHWHKIADSDAVKALAEAGKAQSTADGKSTTFIVQPSNYSKGDLWILASDTTVNGTSYKSGTILTANEASTTYVASHWGEKVKYTDDEVAKQAKQDAAAAQQKADQAQTDATEAKTRLNNWASDSVISPTEKQGIKDEIARIVADKSHIESEYTKYSLGTPTTFNTAYKAYYDVLTTLSATEPETISIPTDFATKQTAYYTERTNALNAISEGAKLYAESYADYVSEYEKLKGVNLCSYKKILDSGFTYASELQSDGSFKIKHSTILAETVNPNNKDMFGMEGEYLENTQYTFTLHNITTNATTGTTLYFIIHYSGGARDDIQIPYDSTTFSFTTREDKTILKIRCSYNNGGYTIAQVKLEVGDTATPYTISPEDREYIVDYELFEITKLQSDFQESLNAINSDEYFSVAEKKIIRTDWEAISGINSTSESNSYTTLSGSYGEAYQLANGKVSTQDLTDKFSALRLFLHNQGTKGLYVDEDWNYGADGRKNMSDRFTAYYNAEIALLQAYNDYYTNKKVGEIEIGGRNLLKNSEEIIAKSVYKVYNVLQNNTNYVISCKNIVKSANSEYTRVVLQIPNGAYKRLVNEWDGTPVKFNTEGGYTILYLYGGNPSTSGQSSTFYNIKLEEGNIATDWTPAPEDIDAEIADTMNAIETLNDDGIFQQSEKLTIRKEWEEISGTAVTPSDSNNVTIPYTYGDSGSYKKTLALIPNDSGISIDDIFFNLETLQVYLDDYRLYRNNKKFLRVGETDPAVVSGFSRSTLAQLFQAYYNEESKIIKAVNDYFAKKQLQDLQIGGANIIPFVDINGWIVTITKKRPEITITSNASNQGGIFFPSKYIAIDTDYVLSFYIKKTSGSILKIGGHMGTGTSEVFIDNVKVSGNWSDTVDFPDDTNEHYVVVKFKQTASTSDNNLYIQPNRNDYTKQFSCIISKIQLEKGNKATAWKPNDADIIEARENIVKEGMMVTLGAGTDEFTLNLTKSLSSNTEYVFSVERSSIERNIYLYYGGTRLVNVKTNTNSAKYFVFTTPSSISSGTTITLSYQEDQETSTILAGVKLAKGNKYVGYEATPEEKDAIMALQTAMKGTTDIIGGLMLTNLIGMKGEDNTINAGISGLDDWNNLRFWAGASWSGASTAPFRVYDDGRVFGTHFYGFFSAFEVNSSNISSVSTTVGSYKQLNLGVTGSNILLNYSSAMITLPSDKKFVGSEVQIYNPNRYGIPTCNFVPFYSQCTIKNYETNATLAIDKYVGAIKLSTAPGSISTSYSMPRWSVQENICNNYKPAYVKFRAVQVNLNVESGYNKYVPYWVKNCKVSGRISNAAETPLNNGQYYYKITSNCTFVIWIMVEYSTSMT